MSTSVVVSAAAKGEVRSHAGVSAGVRAAWLVVAVAALVCAGGQVWLFRSFTPDDAYISLRYAQNLANGAGLTYNPGERVEGFSNPLLVFLEAAAFRCGLDGMVAARTFGLAGFAGIVSLLLVHARRRSRSTAGLLVLAGLGLSVAPASFAMTFYARSGLETVSFAFFVLGTVMTASAGRHGTAWGFATIAALSRPEGVLYLAIPAAAPILAGAAESRSVRGWWRIQARYLAPVVVLLGTGLALRHAYFGAWLPNTFFAKAPWLTSDRVPGWLWPLRGLDDMADFSAQVALPGALVLSAVSWRTVRRSQTFHLATLGLALGFLFQKWSGGDWMLGARFLAPVTALAGLVWIEAAAPLLPLVLRRRRIAWAAAVASLLLLLCHANTAVTFYVNRSEYPNNQMTGEGLRDVGEWLGRHVPTGYLEWSDCIGLIGYYSHCRVCDPQGLVSREVAVALASAHGAPGRAAALASIAARLRPEILVNNPALNPPHELAFAGGEYALVKVGLNGASKVAVYARSDVAASVRGHGD